MYGDSQRLFPTARKEKKIAPFAFCVNKRATGWRHGGRTLLGGPAIPPPPGRNAKPSALSTRRQHPTPTHSRDPIKSPTLTRLVSAMAHPAVPGWWRWLVALYATLTAVLAHPSPWSIEDHREFQSLRIPSQTLLPKEPPPLALCVLVLEHRRTSVDRLGARESLESLRRAVTVGRHLGYVRDVDTFEFIR